MHACRPDGQGETLAREELDALLPVGFAPEIVKGLKDNCFDKALQSAGFLPAHENTSYASYWPMFI
jgi:hypothetical protein